MRRGNPCQNVFLNPVARKGAYKGCWLESAQPAHERDALTPGPEYRVVADDDFIGQIALFQEVTCWRPLGEQHDPCAGQLTP